MFCDHVIELMKILEKNGFKTYVLSTNELILCEKTNSYLILDDFNSKDILKAKLISWCSRKACEEFGVRKQNRFLSVINEYLGCSFTKDEMREIYREFGMSYDYERIILFLENTNKKGD